MGTFILAMTLYPEVQRKAQEELDQVFNGRLPEFIDSDAAEILPYITALTKEVFRWQLITPLAIPHRLMQDDIYKGYFLPKGTIVAPNAWYEQTPSAHQNLGLLENIGPCSTTKASTQTHTTLSLNDS
jgi:cytochrome P450